MGGALVASEPTRFLGFRTDCTHLEAKQVPEAVMGETVRLRPFGATARQPSRWLAKP